jgi:hypothetical protein
MLIFTCRERDCVEANSLITLADGTFKKIKDVQVGDIVKTIDESTKLPSQNMVLDVIDKGELPSFEITQLDGTKLITTGNHKVLTIDPWTKTHSWKTTEELKSGDLMVQASNDNFITVPVVSVTKLPDKAHMFDLCIEKNHNFIANNTVVHNCILSHGASGILKGKLMDLSDKYDVHVCGIAGCGLFAMYNEDTGAVYCKSCKTGSGVVLIQIPYACKLLFQELISLCIVPRIVIDDNKQINNGDSIFVNTEGNVIENMIKELRS